MTVDQKIEALRNLMAQHHLAAYIIPSSDPHQSEYSAAHWKSREWISGFSGSSGLVIITPTHAGLWTDSRYFIQAEKELSNSQLKLHRLKVPHTPEHLAWLLEKLPSKGRIACDGDLFSVVQIQQLQAALKTKDIQIDYDLDLIDPIWPDRPGLPSQQAFGLPITLSGESRKNKLKSIRKEMAALGATNHLISDLGDIAWILNIRSSDIEFNPVLISYLFIEEQQGHLFVEEQKISAELRQELLKDGISIQPYFSIIKFLKELERKGQILIDPYSTSIRLFQCLPETQVIKQTNPSLAMRSIKNKTEIAHIKEAMIKDGVALVKLYRWLERELAERSVSEVEVAAKLDSFRNIQGDYQGESFSAIVGYAGNGAIVHYRPLPEQCAMIKPEGLLLLDSGGQYFQGTTDITRTTALSPPSEEQKRNFTLVLKGHIGLAKLKFPSGTRGNQMDALARQYLWEQGLNYGHGTGHGVGFFLNVHEGPQSIGGGMTAKTAAVFKSGMLTSNEPGFYKPGEYGIRIENLILCVEDQTTEYGQFLRFETLTLYPIDLKLVDDHLLTASEKAWLENYHKKVLDLLSPHLDVEEQRWLESQMIGNKQVKAV